MTLSGTRPWVIAGAVGAVLLLALTWVTVIGPTRSETSTLREDTVTVQQQNQLLTAQVARLRSRDEDRDLIEDKVGRLLRVLPDDAALPELNQQLVQLAAEQGVVLTSITVAAATAPAAGVAGAVPSAEVVSVPVTIQSTGPLVAQLAFVRDVQRTGPRAALVTSTSLSALDVGPGRGYTLTTQFTVFSAALSEADLALLPR